AIRWTTALQEDHRHHPSKLSIRIRREPSITGTALGACPGLAQDLLFAEVQAQAAGCSVLHRSRHTVSHLRDKRLDVQGPLDLRLEADDFVRRVGMLEVIERPAIGNR